MKPRRAASEIMKSPLYAVRRQAVLRAMDFFRLPASIRDISRTISIFLFLYVTVRGFVVRLTYNTVERIAECIAVVVADSPATHSILSKSV